MTTVDNDLTLLVAHIIYHIHTDQFMVCYEDKLYTIYNFVTCFVILLEFFNFYRLFLLTVCKKNKHCNKTTPI